MDPWTAKVLVVIAYVFSAVFGMIYVERAREARRLAIRWFRFGVASVFFAGCVWLLLLIL
jgi:hypothetical protein